MNDRMKRFCEEIDAAIFSGDRLYDKCTLDEFKEYLGRWNRKCENFSDLANDD
jgi:hypothetical protein